MSEAAESKTPSHDHVIPFLIHESNVRGRVVRTTKVIDQILSQHDYPERVSKILGEALLIVSMLASNLKHHGVFTLQARGDGALNLLVVDALYGGELRGYAGFDKEAIAKMQDKDVVSLQDVMGQGHLAITLDMGKDDRYQGVVGLEGETIGDAIQHYFTQSQQVDVSLHTALEKRDGTWRAGALMIERLPDGVLPMNKDAAQDVQEIGEEEWRNAYSLLSTLKDEELLDFEGLSVEKMLYRLYNEAGVVMHDEQPVSRGCRCSREKVENALRTIAKEEIESLKLPSGLVEVTCEFCSKTETFDELQIARLYQ